MFFVHHKARNMQTRLASARITGTFTRYDTNSDVEYYYNFRLRRRLKYAN